MIFTSIPGDWISRAELRRRNELEIPSNEEKLVTEWQHSNSRPLWLDHVESANHLGPHDPIHKSVFGVVSSVRLSHQVVGILTKKLQKNHRVEKGGVKMRYARLTLAPERCFNIL